MRYLLVLVAAIAAFCGQAAAQPEPRKPAVLFVGYPPAIEASEVPEALAARFGLASEASSFEDLSWEKLSRFNAVVFFDLSRVDPQTRGGDHVNVGVERFEQIAALLQRFLAEGGGVYLYGTSFVHMASQPPTDTLNRFLEPLGARVLWEQLHDPSRERKQEGGQAMIYARAEVIHAHPATDGVRGWWYPVGRFGYGPWTKPLALSDDWQPLVETSEGFTATPVDEHGATLTAAASALDAPRAAVYATRQVGPGRVVLNGGESTISFFGYGFSKHADAQWGRIGMENGLGDEPSDGLRLLGSSLRWLAEPSLASGKLGGYVPSAAEPFRPRTAEPIAWGDPQTPADLPYRRGVIGAMPAIGGGGGAVAEYAAAATELGLDFMVCAGDFERMDEAAWRQMMDDCRAATTPSLLVVPALLTRDEQGNRFIQAGPNAWPRPERLSPDDPKRVRHHLDYWMKDANFPFRAPYAFSEGSYPVWLYSAFNAFAVRTYRDGELVDEALEGFIHSSQQGDRARIVVMNLLSAPGRLRDVKEWTYVLAADRAALEDAFLQSQFQGGNVGYVTSGPRVAAWDIANPVRETFGEWVIPGTERWRATLKVVAAAPDRPLELVTIYDGKTPIRHIAVEGMEATVHLDGLHGKRHVLTAVVEDSAGGKATTGSLETGDRLFYQFFCSDRCNIMGGSSTVRDAEGREVVVPATSQLYKAGRLYYGATAKGEALPGVDGSGLGVELSLYPELMLGGHEERHPVHQINRPYESAHAIVFDTPILKRTTTSEVFGHVPYVDLAEPEVAGSLKQWHFYRDPAYPSPVLARMSVKVTDPQGTQLQAGWQGLAVRFAAAWSSRIDSVVILRADGTTEPGAGGEGGPARWSGTLQPGDAFIFPNIGEALLVLDGELGAVIECEPGRKWFRMWTGQFRTDRLAPGSEVSVRLVNLKVSTVDAAAQSEVLAFRDAYGLGTVGPTYTVSATRGSVRDARYPLAVAADGHAFAGIIDREQLPQRLPVEVTGLNDRWSAVSLDLATGDWMPLGTTDGVAYTTLPAGSGESTLFLGHPVTTSDPGLHLTLLPRQPGGAAAVDVHNPTDAAVTATVSVPKATPLAPAQEQAVAVPARSTVRVTLR